MKNSIKKGLSIVLIVVLFGIFMSIVIVNFKKAKSELNGNETNINEETGENAIGVGSGNQEDFYDWKSYLEMDLFKVLESVYPKDYNYNITGREVFKVSLREINDNYDVDFRFLNNEDHECDLENSFFMVSLEGANYLQSLDLKCSKLK